MASVSGTPDIYQMMLQQQLMMQNLMPIELTSGEQSLNWVSSAELLERNPFPLRLDAIKAIVYCAYFTRLSNVTLGVSWHLLDR
jgi:hypothetical protein